MTAFIGIDPGATGALACVTGSGILSDTVPMPMLGKDVDGQALQEIIDTWNHDMNDRVRIVIEKVHAMPKQGVSSTFTFGKGYGIVIGVVQASRLPFEFVTPQEWKKTFTLIGKHKDESRQKATELWPTMRQHWNLKKDHGKTDAALIAEHARRTL